MTIQFQNYAKVNNDSDDKTLYGDIITHCKNWKSFAEPGSKYTTAHECTHGINNDLRLASGNWDAKNGFYLGKDRAIILDEPKVKKSDIIPYIPQSLRGPQFSLYVQGQSEWEDKPLYIYDEGVAYINGCWAAIELKEAENYVESFGDTYIAVNNIRCASVILPVKDSNKLCGWATAPAPLFHKDKAGNTIVDGEIEFIPYMTAVLMATWDKTNHLLLQLTDFSRWLFRHATNGYHRSMKDGFPAFDVQDKLWETMTTSDEAQKMRDFLNQRVGFTFPNDEVPEDDNTPLPDFI